MSIIPGWFVHQPSQPSCGACEQEGSGRSQRLSLLFLLCLEKLQSWELGALVDTGLIQCGRLSLRVGQSTDRWLICPVVGGGVSRWHFYPRAESVVYTFLFPQEEGNSRYLLPSLRLSHRNMHGVTSSGLKTQEMLRRMT